jgi:8-oxo-dGTP pyrophosphatase MutT (NUDIX family)
MTHSQNRYDILPSTESAGSPLREEMTYQVQFISELIARCLLEFCYNKPMNYIFYASTCIIEKNKILLTQQSPNVKNPGTWGLPAGHVERGGTPDQAALRETKEEVNLDVKLIGIVQVIMLKRPGKDDALVINYLGKIEGNQKPKADGVEISNICWTTKEEVEKDKYIWRHPFFKKFVIKAFTDKPTPLNTFDLVRYQK